MYKDIQGGGGENIMPPSILFTPNVKILIGLIMSLVITGLLIIMIKVIPNLVDPQTELLDRLAKKANMLQHSLNRWTEVIKNLNRTIKQPLGHLESLKDDIGTVKVLTRDLQVRDELRRLDVINIIEI